MASAYRRCPMAQLVLAGVIGESFSPDIMGGGRMVSRKATCKGLRHRVALGRVEVSNCAAYPQSERAKAAARPASQGDAKMLENGASDRRLHATRSGGNPMNWTKAQKPPARLAAGQPSGAAGAYDALSAKAGRARGLSRAGWYRLGVSASHLGSAGCRAYT